MSTFMLVFLSISANPQVIWQKVIGKPGVDERIHGTDIDYPSALYAAKGVSEFAVVKFTLDGDSIWSLRYDAVMREESANDVAVGEAGNVYATGRSTGQSGDSTLVLVKFDSESNPICTTTIPLYSGQNVVYSQGGVYVGSSYVYETSGPEPDLMLFRFDEEGNELWRDFYRPADDQTPTGLALGAEGVCYVSCRFPCLWTGWFPDGNYIDKLIGYEGQGANGEGIAIGDAPHVFICGHLRDSRYSFMLLKYDTSGTLLWSDAKTYDLGGDEYCRDVKLDVISDCYLAGWQTSGEDENAVLVKTDSSGRLLWSWVDTTEGKQEIEAIEVDEEGYIYLAGSTHNGEDWDMLVMKLSQPLTIAGRVMDSTGAAMENVTITITGDTTLEVFTDTGGYYGIEVYNGEYTVIPNLAGWLFEPASRTYSPLTHRMLGQDFSNGRNVSVVELKEVLSFELEVNSRAVRFTLPESSQVNLILYDATGRRIGVLAKGLYPKGHHLIDMPELVSGVYFVRLLVQNKSLCNKALVN